ncbi:GntR family transcriptional regulator [Salinispora pacifica]|uniref:GntR family transcriptional regulator n=1 Tax=Salinispora pacifica TaxID=351187 RepID=UPI001E4E42D7|nr:GntR family transcriptional regulator [Salinispora pacifica]
MRDVAQSLAINPNTVSKAYHELELEGLVEGRPGVGTLVTGTRAGASPARPSCAPSSSGGWSGPARPG